jgi:L-fuconolactonase
MAIESNNLSRRELIRGMLAGAAVIGCQALGDDQSSSKVMGSELGGGYIDAHSHVWTDDVEAYPLAGRYRAEDLVPRTFLPEELLELAERNGVQRVVLIQHQVYHGTDNRYMLDTLRRFPGRFSAVAYIDAANPQVVEEMVCLHNAGARGLRICAGDGGVARWSESRNMKSMWRQGAESGVVMCPQINPDYLPELDHMCRMFPDTTVVVDHFAKIGTDGSVRNSDLDRLAGLADHPRVHAKLSAFYGIGDKKPPYDEIVPMIRRMYDAFGPERLMWSSDCPYQLFGENSYEASIALVRDGIDFFSATDKEWILRKTAERVFFG